MINTSECAAVEMSELFRVAALMLGHRSPERAMAALQQRPDGGLDIGVGMLSAGHLLVHSNETKKTKLSIKYR